MTDSIKHIDTHAVSGVVPLEFDEIDDIDSLIFNPDDIWWRGVVIVPDRTWED